MHNQDIQTAIQRIIDINEKANIVTDVSVYDYASNQMMVSHNDTTEQFAASVNKVPVSELLLADLRLGTLKFDQELSWPESEVLPGTGFYDQPGAPTHATLKELFFDMLNRSGNTAVNVFVQNVLGGAEAVNGRFKSELQLVHTYLQPLPDGNFYLGNTASAEALGNIQKLLSGDDQYQQYVLNALSTDIFTDYGVRSQVSADQESSLANKVGFLNDPSGNNRHDAGIIYGDAGNPRFAYGFLTTAQGVDYNYPTSQGGVSLAEMGAILLEYCHD